MLAGRSIRQNDARASFRQTTAAALGSGTSRVSAEIGAVEVAPAAARGRDAALASQFRVRTDQDRDDGEEQTEAERLHGGQYRAGQRERHGDPRALAGRFD